VSSSGWQNIFISSWEKIEYLHVHIVFIMKYTLAIIILLLSVPALYAQKIHFGPKLDATIPTITGKGISNGSVGIQAGGFLQLELGKQWSIQPELFYSLRNIKKSGEFLTYYVNSGRNGGITKMQLHYISLPVLARFDLNDKFSFLAGPQINYLFFAKEDLLLSEKKAFKKLDIGASVGAQFNLTNLSFSLRYNPGLYNINNIDDRYAWKSGQVQIGIAVKIK
jgi:hypothetical protein